MNGSDQISYSDEGVTRVDLSVPKDGDLNIFVRKVTTSESKPDHVILLHHGARVPSVPSFDLNVPNGSLAADLAKTGATVFLMDGRGYGFSDRPHEMTVPNEVGESSVRADTVVRDIGRVVDFVTEDTGAKPILLGWATGALWAGHYASVFSDAVAGLILYNPVYGGVDGHPTWGSGSPLEDPEDPAKFNRAKFGKYRLCDAADTLAKWDKSFPGRNIDECRDPVVRDAYVELALASDNTSSVRSPRTYRAPSGALEDTYYAMRGRQLYDASLIRTPVLVLRCAEDFLAREEEILLLKSHLVSSPKVVFETVPNASHYAHLDRPGAGRNATIDAISVFLGIK